MKAIVVYAQCPPNIGFESASFANWECFAGAVDGSGNPNVMPTSPIADRHQLTNNNLPIQKDFYGDFPVSCPNGSNYSVKLGNEAGGAGAERISYTFTIPAGQDEYSLIYNYAVVFENPNHAGHQQPRFTARVFDVANNDYVGCGSFEFVASGGLPGFQSSPKKASVFYKSWSPITIRLFNSAGKTFRLEFTTNDCTLGGHFGYAYIDVMENCKSPITGNTYCAGADGITLTAPFGFQAYRWYDASFTTLLGTNNTLRITPAPPANTVYALEIIPFPGLGCLDTLRTTINASTDLFNLVVRDSLSSCSTTGVDLTAASVTAGSTAGMTLNYFTDLTQTSYVLTPTTVTAAGIYYIKGENAVGCNDIKPTIVTLYPPPVFSVTNPGIVCPPNTVNLTDTLVTAGSEAGLTYTYWNDALASIPLNNPNSIDAAGVYYIKAVSVAGCEEIKAVPVAIGIAPQLTTNAVNGCGFVSLTNPGVAITSPANSVLSYWTNVAATSPISNPSSINNSGTYFIQSTSGSGCSVVKSVDATVYPIPSFTITQPPVLYFPATVNLNNIVNPSMNATYSFWLDSNTTIPVANPQRVDSTGTYYIKATTSDGCSYLQSVDLTIFEPPLTPPNAISPNGDGINDYWNIKNINRYPKCEVEIFDRYGQRVFASTGYSKPWDGTLKGKPLPVGTYYYVIKPGGIYQQVAGYVVIVY